MRTQRIGPTILILLAAACASKSKSPTDAASRASTSSERSSDVITAAELHDVSVSNGDALAAVRRLRPRYLVARGAASIRTADAGSVHVSVDGGALQTVSILSRMRPTEISEIRYLSSSEAAQRFGTVAGAGSVLLVKTR